MIASKNLFSTLGLNNFLIKSLNYLGYMKPSPIQRACIPYLLSKKDVLGVAQTGSGKTAAFALPLLQNIVLYLKYPQILVLTPTRELSIQISTSFVEFAKYIKGIKILPIYGGQKYETQLLALKKRPQVVVGTPGRLIDHLKRNTLNLSQLQSLVIDEADEMLKMGFIEDVENIILKIPVKHQTALFSATMPETIRNISKNIMYHPKEIIVHSNVITKPNIYQNYWMVHGRKTNGLIKFLELEDCSSIIIFVRTKSATLEVSEILLKHGYNSSALNGDMNQILREDTLKKFKNGQLNILIATDVASRGLDIDRVSLVINYDIPIDSESYIHRIGRTGRAGRMGRALLFVERREIRFLKNIEHMLKKPIIEIKLPNSQLLMKYKLDRFYLQIINHLNNNNLYKYRNLLKKLCPNKKFNIEILSLVLLKISQKILQLIIPIKYTNKNKNFNNIKKLKNIKKITCDKKKNYRLNDTMRDYRIQLGKNDGIEVRHIVGAFLNEGNISNYHIGNIQIFSNYTIIELSTNIPKNNLNDLSRIRILNKFTYLERYKKK
ncbi:DEAD/DEAH box helicase [Buchnera aphidicola]|uniref:DEAD-box ATP-dependent RNA helicase RhpA n=1 Tax=Buchnera aphidicola (Stegophylla sp.) TaxID=2315800 RepID=A0A4D6Y9K6_9GAMM|nr:DEAD/DEAH box helicase [Buchnera aphidicola (Stegophylla sp.)]